MVGNDVVDLRDPEAQHSVLHPRFDHRVFTSAELDLIAASDNPHEMRWSLWACKESAFKLVKRHFPAVVFSHRNFRVEMKSGSAARVRYRSHSVAVSLSRCADAVHAVAVWAADDGCRTLSAVGESRLDSSSAVRELAKTRISRELNRLPSEIEFSPESGRIPRLMVGGRASSLPISLSHHGAYVAFACFFFLGYSTNS